MKAVKCISGFESTEGFRCVLESCFADVLDRFRVWRPLAPAIFWDVGLDIVAAVAKEARSARRWRLRGEVRAG
jgi:hypothetical protein